MAEFFLPDPDAVPDCIIIGCGGAGTRIVDQVHLARKLPFRTIAVETDAQVLDTVRADMHALLGENRIKGWGEGDPGESAQALIDASAKIESTIRLGDLVFLIAGLGGGAGSGAAPEIARLALEKGALVIAVVTLPFRVQERTIKKAMDGLKGLLRYADTVVVFDNECYRSRFCNCNVRTIYSNVNGMIAGLVLGIIRSLTVPCLINAGYEDVRTVFKKKGLALVLAGESGEEAENVNESVVRKCLNSPSFDRDYRSATGCFVLIQGGNNLDLNDAEEIATSLTFEIDPHADVVWSEMIDNSREGRVRVCAVMTGIDPG